MPRKVEAKEAIVRVRGSIDIQKKNTINILIMAYHAIGNTLALLSRKHHKSIFSVLSFPRFMSDGIGGRLQI